MAVSKKATKATKSSKKQVGLHATEKLRALDTTPRSQIEDDFIRAEDDLTEEFSTDSDNLADELGDEFSDEDELSGLSGDLDDDLTEDLSEELATEKYFRDTDTRLDDDDGGIPRGW